MTSDPLPSPVPPGLAARYAPEHLSVFTAQELDRFLGPERPPPDEIVGRLAWELLYRHEPELYERLVAGERLHPRVWEVFPSRVGRAVEVAAGAGRLTLDLVSRCDELIAVEPAPAMRDLLRRRLSEAGQDAGVRVDHGFFDSIPAPDGWADLVCSCSAFTPDSAHGGEAGLRELERVCAPGGTIILVWPVEPSWLQERGFTYVSFPGEMSVDFGSVDEAVALARIFYPDAVEAITARGSGSVPYELLGTDGPRDVAYRRLSG